MKDKLAILLLCLIFGSIFFYHLGYPVLESWDEAWYAAISKEMAKSGDLLHMNWNGKLFADHPPMGFWLMSASIKLFGVNEFGVRFPSALLGLFSVILIYLASVRLFKNQLISLASSLILGTSVWYVIRVRSGNLDSFFVFFSMLSVYLAIKTEKNIKWLPLTALSFAALMLTKTLAGILLLPILLLFAYKHFLHPRRNFIYLAGSIILFFLLFLPWYIEQSNVYPDFYNFHFGNIGMRNQGLSNYLDISSAEQTLFYLHMGVRKWYKLWILAILAILISGKFLKKEYFSIMLWNGIALFPFLSRSETHIHHLLPIYLPLSILTASGIYVFFNIFFSLAFKILSNRVKILKTKYLKKAISVSYILFFIIIAAIQVKIFAWEVFPVYKFTPDNVLMLEKVNKYKGKTYLDDDFFPVAVFYTDRKIYPMYDLGTFGETSDKKTLVDLFLNEDEKFIVITRTWALDHLKEKNIRYKVLEKNKSFAIATKPKWY